MTWLRKGIRMELCKKLKSDHTTKWCMQKLDSVFENETQNSLRFAIATDHLISFKRPDHVMIRRKKRISQIVLFAMSANYGMKINENEKRN